MSEETVDPTGVFVVGNFFNGSPEPLDNNGDGTWSYNASFTKGDSLFYLFQNGMSNESLIGNTCSSGDRRILIAPNEEEVILPTVCFNYCNACDALSTSINEFLLSHFSFRLFPNPFVDRTVAYWENGQDFITNIQLLDFSGRILRSYNNFIDNQLVIEKKSLLSGIYFLKINDQKGRVGTYKLVVQ